MEPSQYFPNETMSEYQLEIRWESSYFHSTDKGCVIFRKKTPVPSLARMIDGRFCKTHEVELCQCGWEWQHHYNEGVRNTEGNN